MPGTVIGVGLKEVPGTKLGVGLEDIAFVMQLSAYLAGKKNKNQIKQVESLHRRPSKYKHLYLEV